jgi:small subunit ribosomal protein S21
MPRDCLLVTNHQHFGLMTRTQFGRDTTLQVLVRDNNVDQALRVLKKKMQREGVFREMKRRRFFEKPSERSTREKAEAVRRARKLARKQAIREGLIAAPKKAGLQSGTSSAARGRPVAR